MPGTFSTTHTLGVQSLSFISVIIDRSVMHQQLGAALGPASGHLLCLSACLCACPSARMRVTSRHPCLVCIYRATRKWTQHQKYTMAPKIATDQCQSTTKVATLHFLVTAPPTHRFSNVLHLQAVHIFRQLRTLLGCIYRNEEDETGDC